ncbi:MAG: hypothetical protein JSW53_06340 [Candidatus Bathyarchaeota archaeon]|nr:MAG: hypothetical protein JSW53_06340 [Candidatus Bathyarchaeota archaeon]
MRTYLKMWYNSEGANPVIVSEKLQAMGFEAITGQYDYVYNWRRDVDLEDILQIMTSVHETLKGLKVLYKMETM